LPAGKGIAELYAAAKTMAELARVRVRKGHNLAGTAGILSAEPPPREASIGTADFSIIRGS